MAWLAIDGDKTEYIYEAKPVRYKNCWSTQYDKDRNPIGGLVLLPKGSIYKLIGKNLTWEDEPIEM